MFAIEFITVSYFKNIVENLAVFFAHLYFNTLEDMDDEGWTLQQKINIVLITI